ncbi:MULTISPECIES: hypothetical protein [Halorussus]|uniref:hypothetical protein n=1 Tax=Halorussus TaxID=1070314 RepID=UPI000E2183A6|nr:MULTISPECIES: hypothetical protein [Halorussus]NHN59542.1 hypothetical protein [Halorussus sp. JP-T4]
MLAIIDGILNATRNRSAKEESPGTEVDADLYALCGNHLGASIARRLRADGNSIGPVDETRVPAEMPGRRAGQELVRATAALTDSVAEGLQNVRVDAEETA